MDKEKYYVPDIGEFCVGFKYEQFGPDGEWSKEIYGGDNPALGWMLPAEFFGKFCDEYVRVKYLDREDINSLGWHGCSVLDYKEKEHDFVDGWEFSLGDGKTTYVLQNVKYNKWVIWRQDCYNEASGNWTAQDMFFGEIKNKSELKRLMNQLGINK